MLVRRILAILTALLAIGQAWSALAAEVEPLIDPTDPQAEITTWPLPILVEPLSGDLDRIQTDKLEKVLLDTLYSYSNLAIYTHQQFVNQLGWERKNKRIDCRFAEECTEALKERLGIHHTLQLIVAERADGQLNLKLNLKSGERHREMVETIPEFGAAPVVLQSMIPDVIGMLPDVHREQGVIHVVSFPLGATVEVDGVSVGKTPVSIIADHGRTLELMASRQGHPPQYVVLRARAGSVLIWDADLVTRQGEVLVDSTPADAEIMLDGRSAGQTPRVLENVTAGRHTIRLNLPPYPVAEFEIEVTPDDLTRVVHTFENASGTLVVNFDVEGEKSTAEIYLNGAKVAENTYKADLPPGRYTIDIVAKHYKTHHAEIELKAGKTSVISPMLESGLSLAPGQQMGVQADYRPGGFTTALGALVLAFGIYAEIEAQKGYENASKYDSYAAMAAANNNEDEQKKWLNTASGARSEARDTRIAGGVMMGLGAAATIAGIVLLILPPEQPVAISPTVNPENGDVSVNLSLEF